MPHHSPDLPGKSPTTKLTKGQNTKATKNSEPDPLFLVALVP